MKPPMVPPGGSAALESIRLAKAYPNLTADQLGSLGMSDATDADLARLAAVEPAEARDRAVGYFASGDSIDQAIDAAGKPSTPKGKLPVYVRSRS